MVASWIRRLPERSVSAKLHHRRINCASREVGGQSGSYYLADISNPVLAQNMPLKMTMPGWSGAVAVALEDAEEGGPGADGFSVLVRHGARDLVEVGEVVRGPGGEELGERDGAEVG